MSDSSKTIVVTGAGSGIGQAVAQRFASEGWQVALVGWRDETLRQTMARFDAGAQRRAAGFRCDVSRAADVDAMAAAVIERFGRVDVLVNSAGINVPKRSLRELSLEDWHRVIDTNLNGAYYCIRAFLPAMRAQRDGTIVNINSDVGKLARDLAGPAYVTSKFGMTGLTQQINAEERANGIRATSIFPRDVNTPLLDKRPQPPPADVRARMLQPADLAACVWLAATLPSHAIVDEIVLSTR
ncbi:MAG TPA: SDR family oxidoreductase [Vicinamibacterales bacterium]|nr:SDR family oxidoreductase [Vicinamibacterales bacterium]